MALFNLAASLKTHYNLNGIQEIQNQNQIISLKVELNLHATTVKVLSLSFHKC